MPLSVADLDSKFCSHCGGSLRDHCNHHEGAWYYTPCDQHLLSLAPITWQWILDANERCVNCGGSIRDHFVLWTPQASISLGTSQADIVASGDVIVRLPDQFRDCR